MKNIKLMTSAIGAACATSALLMSANTFALGYDSSSDAPSGGREDELHAVQATTEAGDCAPDPANPGTTFCDSSFSNDSEFTSIFVVDNASPCVPIAALGGACRNVGAGVGAVSANVTDNYSGGAFEAAVGPTPTVQYGSVFLPDCPEAAAAGACFREFSLTSTFYSWNFNTAANGMITDGFLIADSNFGSGAATAGVFIFPELVFRTYRGAAPAGFPTVADRDCVVDPNADYLTCWASASAGTGPSSESQFDYLTYPSVDFQLVKSVPVPAFAAAILGLGLVGITLLTGHRRKIK